MKTILGSLSKNQTNPSPKIDCWLAENSSLDIGIIIFPGGAYHHLAEHEGRGYAEYFSSVGISCFVVHYRLAPEEYKHPSMLEDALAAIETVRSRAEEFKLDPNKIGVMGSSAGGHLAAHSLVAWDQYESDVSLKPNFGVLCYPVIVSSGPFAHKGSMINLAGEEASTELLEELSCDKQVTKDTSPCFLWHTVEDNCVPLENSLIFLSALKKHEVPFEFHAYEKGVHGIGMKTPYNWEAVCLRWIKERMSS